MSYGIVARGERIAVVAAIACGESSALGRSVGIVDSNLLEQMVDGGRVKAGRRH